VESRIQPGDPSAKVPRSDERTLRADETIGSCDAVVTVMAA
jgi:hypothetical protein